MSMSMNQWIHRFHENNELHCSSTCASVRSVMPFAEFRQAARGAPPAARISPSAWSTCSRWRSARIRPCSRWSARSSSARCRFADPDRLITFTIVRPGNRPPAALAARRGRLQASQASTLDGVASVFGWSANLTGPWRRRAAHRRCACPLTTSSSRARRSSSVAPLQATDEQRPSALISHGMWQRRFGGAVDAVGQPIVLNGEAFTIVGVLRPDFVSLVRDADIVVPYSPATDARRGNRAQGIPAGRRSIETRRDRCPGR